MRRTKASLIYRRTKNLRAVQLRLVRWYRTGAWLTDGRRFLVWEYPRQAPDGDQVDLVDVMEIANGRIRHHRVYWGWKGCRLIAPALARCGSN